MRKGIKKFDISIETAVFTTKYVLDNKKTITHVVHEIDDGDWQFFSNDSFENFEEVARIVGFQEILNLDNSLIEITDLPCGFFATRKDKFDKWTIKEDK